MTSSKSAKTSGSVSDKIGAIFFVLISPTVLKIPLMNLSTKLKLKV